MEGRWRSPLLGESGVMVMTGAPRGGSFRCHPSEELQKCSAGIGVDSRPESPVVPDSRAGGLVPRGAKVGSGVPVFSPPPFLLPPGTTAHWKKSGVRGSPGSWLTILES